MIATILAIAAIGQLRPDTMLDAKHDAKFYRWVQEARVQANQWAFVEAADLFPAQEMAIAGIRNPPLSRKLYERKEYAEVVLKQAAYRQICEAYDISPKEFRMMTYHAGVASLPLSPDPDARIPGGIRMRRGMMGLEQTRFDPEKVVLPGKVAVRIRYRNPRPEKPSKPEIFSKEVQKMNNGGSSSVSPDQGDTFTSKKP